MAPRANWKGFLRLSLVTCPVALYPATSESEKISFNQLNRKTGHRIKYAKVDADTGEEVDNEDIVKGYKVDTDTFVEVTKEELENVALELTRTIEIDEFVDRSEIDPRYLIRPTTCVRTARLTKVSTRGLGGGGCSHMRTRLDHKFPIIREFNREFGSLAHVWRGLDEFPRQRERLMLIYSCAVIGNCGRPIGNSVPRNGIN